MSAAIRLRNLNIAKAVQDQMVAFFAWAGVDNTLTAIVTSRNRQDQRPVRSLTLQAINNIGHWWCAQYPTYQQSLARGGQAGRGLRSLGSALKSIANSVRAGSVNWFRGWGRNRGSEAVSAGQVASLAAAAVRSGHDGPESARADALRDTIDHHAGLDARHSIPIHPDPGHQHQAGVAGAVAEGLVLNPPAAHDSIMAAGRAAGEESVEPRGAQTEYTSVRGAAAALRPDTAGTPRAAVMTHRGRGVAGRGGGRKRPGRGYKKAAAKKTRKQRAKKTRRRQNKRGRKGKNTRAHK